MTEQLLMTALLSGCFCFITGVIVTLLVLMLFFGRKISAYEQEIERQSDEDIERIAQAILKSRTKGSEE